MRTEVGSYVYGVVADPDRTGDRLPDGLTGLQGASLRLVRHEGLAAVVSDAPLEGRPGRAAELRSHGEVLDALAKATGVVPAQFGAVLPDDDDVVAEVLAPRVAELTDLVEQLRGRVQLNLQASYHEDVVLAEVVASDPEVAALRERTRDLPEDAGYGERVRLGELVSRALEAKRADDTEVLLDAVVPHVDAWAERGSAGGVDSLLDVALLVPLSRVAEVEQHLEGLAEAVHERIRLRLVGPVAPYDFVGGEGWA